MLTKLSTEVVAKASIFLDFGSSSNTYLVSAIPSDWAKEDFLALALHYAANADLRIIDTERGYIKAQCGTEHYDKAESFSATLSDYEVITAISAGRAQFYPGEEGKQALDKQLRALFRSDNDFSSLEKSVLHALERLF